MKISQMYVRYTIPHTIHVWYIYTHIYIVDFYGIKVGKYTIRPMDHMETVDAMDNWSPQGWPLLVVNGVVL